MENLPLCLEISHCEAESFISKHVRLEEVYDWRESKCPILGISPRTLEAFEHIRLRLGGKPLRILSGFRTPATNAEVGGAKNSYHMQGRALDIEIPQGRMIEAEKYAEEFFGETGGIGIYPTFIHIDDRGRKTRWRKS